ncbi:MAG: DNA-directed RNA polymerase subunit beta, partial [Parcubacteria group bacterium]|nr:DNA-directed RNA polymerase subunit beta [Parcubacteria group bacterium]
MIKTRPQKIFSSFIPHHEFSPPNLIEVQRASFDLFLQKGLRELFEEISPIADFSGKDLALSFTDYYLDEPKFDEAAAKQHSVSYEAALRARARLENKRTGEIKEQEIYFGDFPLMTKRGTFIINGVERVVVSQLIRSSGVFFSAEFVKGRKLFGAKVIPNRGAWLEFDTDIDNVISVKIDRKRKVPVTTLLNAFGIEDIETRFADVDTHPENRYIDATRERDIAKNQADAFIEIYKRIRPGDLATADNARQLIEGMFFRFERYDLARVGRYKMNQRLALKTSHDDPKMRIFRPEDLVAIVRELIRLNNSPHEQPDDIDHLGNRRVRTFGELLQNKLRVGLARMERIIRDRMSTLDIYTLTPAQLINARPLMAAVKEFFASSQLSQFMDQVNPLSELEHKRRLSAMGPGGLTRERAGFDVRDVHVSHYGRICPIQTPEGPNIGLVGHLAIYARINEFGFIETPYRKVKHGKVTNEIIYLNASQEARENIAHAGEPYGKDGRFLNDFVEARIHGEPGVLARDEVTYTDVAPQQFISVATSLIPFLENDDATRALMGS